MIAANSDVLVTLIGTPAALIAAIGTVTYVSRRSAKPSNRPKRRYYDYPTYDEEQEIVSDGGRHVTQAEMKEVVSELKRDVREMETRQNSKLDLIVSILKKNGGS